MFNSLELVVVGAVQWHGELVVAGAGGDGQVHAGAAAAGPGGVQGAGQARLRDAPEEHRREGAEDEDQRQAQEAAGPSAQHGQGTYHAHAYYTLRAAEATVLIAFVDETANEHLGHVGPRGGAHQGPPEPAADMSRRRARR